MIEDEYVEIGRNDYRNLPQYQKFRMKKEKPKNTPYGKVYHFFSPEAAMSNEQLAVEGTVKKQKMIRAGYMAVFGVICAILQYVLFRAFPNAEKTEELIISFFECAAYLLWMNAVLMVVGAIQSPVTIKDVQKYDSKIQAALRELEKHDRKRALVDSHKKRKGSMRNKKP